MLGFCSLWSRAWILFKILAITNVQIVGVFQLIVISIETNEPRQLALGIASKKHLLSTYLPQVSC